MDVNVMKGKTVVELRDELKELLQEQFNLLPKAPDIEDEEDID